ncbi:MAG: SDR family NAD(P)-dependent oxidoreductase [Pseudomonadota bacterium]
MANRLQGKVALVFGVGSVGPGFGNGRASAIQFAREGAQLYGTDIDAAAAEETARLVRDDGGEITVSTADITREADIAAAVQACLAAYGRIDILLNNVGGSMPGGPVEMTAEVWDRQFATNIDYVFLACKHVIPVMERQFAETGNGGSIINLASIAGLRHFGPNVAAYAASKAGVIKFSQVTGVQYAAKNIRVNTIVPGLMNTPLVESRLAVRRADGDVEALKRQRDAQVPMGRMGEAWDVANAAVFLASEEARYITATEIIVDGGLSAATRLPPETA